MTRTADDVMKMIKALSPRSDHELSPSDTMLLFNRIAELEAIVEKLPRYEDTGEPFVPGFDVAYVVFANGVGLVYSAYEETGGEPDEHEWTWYSYASDGGRYLAAQGEAYSTLEAANAARQSTQP